MKRGPKSIHPGEPMKKQAVAVDSMTLRKLKVLGDGNISAGVRKAADVAYNAYQRSSGEVT